jgi:hypothetical protein
MNQDYKTADRRARTNLLLVKTLTAEYESQGMPHDAAIDVAATMVLWPVRVLTPEAKKAQSEGIGEMKFVASTRPEFRKAARKAYRAAKNGEITHEVA